MGHVGSFWTALYNNKFPYVLFTRCRVLHQAVVVTPEQPILPASLSHRLTIARHKIESSNETIPEPLAPAGLALRREGLLYQCPLAVTPSK
jgi:hypothetical protein